MSDSIAAANDTSRDPNYRLGAAEAQLALIRRAAKAALVPADVDDRNPWDALEQILAIAEVNL